jgi:phage gpG-like protein
MSGIVIKIREIVPSSTYRALDHRLVPHAITAGLKDIGTNLVKTAKRGISDSPKTHKLYFYPGLGYVRSSQPHTYPAYQSGRLRRSISYKINGYKMSFGAKQYYAKYLQQTNSPEERSRWVKIAPRPFLTLSHNENRSKFGSIMEDNFEKLTK